MEQRSSSSPVSLGQESLWLASKRDPKNASFNIYLAFRILQGGSSIEIRRIAEEILAENEQLRATFRIENNELRESIAAEQDPFLQSSHVAYLQDEQVAATIREYSRRPFDLENGPLMKCYLLRRGRGESILMAVFHHVVCDGWSLHVVFEQFVKKCIVGKQHPAVIPATPLPTYGQYVLWQRQMLEGAVGEAHRDYWQRTLAGVVPTKYLEDQGIGQIRAGRGYGATEFEISSPLLERCRGFSSRNGVSLYVLFLTAFKILLHRYTAQNEILVMSPMLGRPGRGFRRVVGYFANPVVLRTRLFPDFDCLRGLEEVQSVVGGAVEHQDYPFPLVVEKLIREPYRDGMPVTNIGFGWVKLPRLTVFEKDLKAAGIKMETFPFRQHDSIYDVDLEIYDSTSSLSAQLRFSHSVFGLHQSRQFCTHYLRILEGIVENPKAKLSELPMLEDEEREQLVVGWNATDREYPTERIHRLFEARVREAGAAVALVCGGRRLSYEELNRRANQVAHRLQREGVGRGTVVGVCIERSLEMVAVLLGVLKAGGAYVPLDPAYPKERIAYMLGDSGAQVAVADRRSAGALPRHDARVVCVDAGWGALAGEREQDPEVPGDPEDLAYVMYTSGSTGKPKGVMGTHRAEVNRVQWMWERYPFGEGEVCCQKTSLSFVDSVGEIFGPLLQGIRSVIIADEELKDPPRLVETLRRHRVSRMVLVPSLLRLLLDSRIELGRELAALRLWVCGGESLSAQTVRRFRERMPEATLLNLYGSTEAAGDVSWYDTRRLGEDERRVPIGRPIANTRIYVVDEQLNPVPVGAVGEICVGGAGLARGYWGDAELQRQRFIDSPFQAGERLYKSGDMGRYLPNGDIEFWGRRDQQVKVRGYRVDTEEVESVLRGQAGIREVVVDAAREGAESTRLVAYYTVKEGHEVRADELRRAVKQMLPEYMVPSLYVVLQRMPLTPSGKIDREALPEPSGEVVRGQNEYEAPRDELERRLVEIWEKVLGVKPIGIRDNFFELGGHSLLAAELFSVIEKETGVNVPMKILFSDPTIEQIAGALRSKSWKPDWSSLVLIRSGGDEHPLFLIHGAEGNVLLYKRLAGYLDQRRPVYGIQAQGLDPSSRVIDTIEGMAAHYVREILSVQPVGPYYLGGYCMGGTVAYEVARSLTAAGHEIGLLALLDTYNIHALNRRSTFPDRLLYSLQRFVFNIKNFRQSGASSRWVFLTDKASTVRNRMRVRANVLIAAIAHRLRLKIGKNYPHVRVDRVNDRAQTRYVPRPFAGRIALFRPRTNFSLESDPQFGWSGVAGRGVQTHVLDVHPRGMLQEPYVGLLAEELNRCLSSGAARSASEVPSARAAL